MMRSARTALNPCAVTRAYITTFAREVSRQVVLSLALHIGGPKESPYAKSFAGGFIRFPPQIDSFYVHSGSRSVLHSAVLPAAQKLMSSWAHWLSSFFDSSSLSSKPRFFICPAVGALLLPFPNSAFLYAACKAMVRAACHKKCALAPGHEDQVGARGTILGVDVVVGTAHLFLVVQALVVVL